MGLIVLFEIDEYFFIHFLLIKKGGLSEFRLLLIKRAFEKVDVNKHGQVTLEDLGNAFKATKHPAVKHIC